ncbi:Uma2 family endonuclease [Kitasatospora azatica]|uniref:Uma2 family endonuclease n=1 Tax=Kitasatospora azatica TaxID=58347 RepID=UPI000563735A|nr:Uma2 family endonuclease [Kitasatospora azatica]
MTAVPDWMIPPVEGFTAEDLDRLPDLPPHTELLDGSLVLVSPQKYYHMIAIDLLKDGLRAAAPPDFRVAREMTVTLGKFDRPEPDIMVVRASAVAARGQNSTFLPEDVLLAIEVVSPESVRRDRDIKPEKYARAGIPHFWRVEEDQRGRPVVYVFELEPASQTYIGVDVCHNRLKVTEPYSIDIDLTAIDTY